MEKIENEKSVENEQNPNEDEEEDDEDEKEEVKKKNHTQTHNRIQNIYSSSSSLNAQCAYAKEGNQVRDETPRPLRRITTARSRVSSLMLLESCVFLFFRQTFDVLSNRVRVRCSSFYFSSAAAKLLLLLLFFYHELKVTDGVVQY